MTLLTPNRPDRVTTEQLEEMLAGCAHFHDFERVSTDVATLRSILTELIASRAHPPRPETVTDEVLEEATRSIVAMIDEWYGDWPGQHIPARAVAKRLSRFLPSAAALHGGKSK